MQIRPSTLADKDAIFAMLAASGKFDEESLAFVEATFVAHFEEPSEELWFAADDGEPIGVAYCSPEPVTNGTWNLILLWVHPDHHGKGIGTRLVKAVESAIKEQSARLLIVETSSLPSFATARAFYATKGFSHESTIRDFYDTGDDKLTFTKSFV